MKCLKATLAYFFDKGAQMVLLAVVPSLLTALLFSPSAGLYMLLEFETVNTEGFAALYEQMHFLPYDFFWVGIIGLVLCFFVLALLFGIVDRHMRIGEFTISFSRAKTRINYNILTAAKFGLTVGVIFELCDLLLTLLYYVWAQVFGAGAAWLVFALISLLAVGVLLLFIACAILLWPPFMLHTGLRTRDAFRMGWRQMSGRVSSSALTLLVAVLPFVAVMLIVGGITDSTVARVILDGLSIAVGIPYYVTLMYVQFYDVTGTERMDLQKTDIWSKKISRKDFKKLREGKKEG